MAETPRIAEEMAAIAAAARRERRRGRVWTLGAIAAILSGLGVGLWLTGRPGADAPAYRTVAPAIGDIVEHVTATGTVFPTEEVDVSSTVSGTVTEVLVYYDDRVAAGDVLARIDPRRFEAQRDRALAERDIARAAMREAAASIAEMEAVVARKRALIRSEISSAQDLDTARAALQRAEASHARARAELDLAEAALRLAEADLADTEITAPIDGIVLKRGIDPGQTIAVSLQAPSLFEIARDLGRMEVRLDIDEADIGRLSESQPVSFTVDAWPDRRFATDLHSIRFASEIVQGVVTYKAILIVDNADGALRPGMTATAEIAVARADAALIVPNAALRWQPDEQAAAAPEPSWLQRLIPGPPAPAGAPVPQTATPPQGGSVVYRLTGEGPAAAPEPVPVRIGPSDGRHSAILGGALQPDDRVIVGQLAGAP
jgi:HlyD family secretion protein